MKVQRPSIHPRQTELAWAPPTFILPLRASHAVTRIMGLICFCPGRMGMNAHVLLAAYARDARYHSRKRNHLFPRQRKTLFTLSLSLSLSVLEPKVGHLWLAAPFRLSLPPSPMLLDFVFGGKSPLLLWCCSSSDAVCLYLLLPSFKKNLSISFLRW